ncbi:MAG: MopE-related protein, partial [Nanoarchaeota archaeon]
YTIDNRDSDGYGIINHYDTWPLGFEIPIQQNLPAGFESSGIVWHPFYGASFLVSDKGTVSKVNLDGLGVTSWSMSGDLEGITIADPASKYVYIVVEFPSQLIQFDPSTGTKVKTISLAGVVPATIDPNLGIQGVAYVPFGYHPYTNIKNGLFYFGVQEDGKIHVVNVDFTSGIVALIDSFTPVSGRVDISDLYFSTETKILYILYDSTNLLREITVNNTYLKESFLPGKNLDGVTVLSHCSDTEATLIVAEDAGRVMKYGNYPIACVVVPPKDNDGDGYTVDVDCNDNDANINPGKIEILYNGKDDDCNTATSDTVDADKDGYNSNVDCNDNNAAINPGKTEIIANGIDDDCNILTLDLPDSDGDGVIDPLDECPGFDDHIDVDGDGVPDMCDNVNNLDSDGDGYPDIEDKCPGFDDKLDLDQDGLPDGCDATDDRDQDGDGLTNTQEKSYGTNPLVSDTDNDKLSDGQEVLVYLTNPLDFDSDDGRVSDGQEIIDKTNPLNKSDDIFLNPNLILSFTIKADKVLVKYADKTQLTIDPYKGISPISAATNNRSDRMILTNGQYLSVFQRDTKVAEVQFNRGVSNIFVLSIKNMGTYDLITVKYSLFGTFTKAFKETTVTKNFKLVHNTLTAI